MKTACTPQGLWRGGVLPAVPGPSAAHNQAPCASACCRTCSILGLGPECADQLDQRLEYSSPSGLATELCYASLPQLFAPPPPSYYPSPSNDSTSYYPRLNTTNDTTASAQSATGYCRHGGELGTQTRCAAQDGQTCSLLPGCAWHAQCRHEACSPGDSYCLQRQAAAPLCVTLTKALVAGAPANFTGGAWLVGLGPEEVSQPTSHCAICHAHQTPLPRFLPLSSRRLQPAAHVLHRLLHPIRRLHHLPGPDGQPRRPGQVASRELGCGWRLVVRRGR